MAYSKLLVLLGLAVLSKEGLANTDVPPRPRGVGPELVKYYKDATTFSCISNPEITIPFSAVNDDYCDCPDGSDEPGTSACSYLSRLSPPIADGNREVRSGQAPSLPGFYCANKGHRPAYISHLRVNDGVCDYDICCDGSDEWAQPGGHKCENRCKEIGAEWKKEEDKRQKSMTTASQKRKELVAKASKARTEIEAGIARLEAEIRKAEENLDHLRSKLNTAKEEDKLRVKEKKSQKGPAAKLAEEAKKRVEDLRQALIDAQRQRDESRTVIAELELILSKLKEEYNPNFNDEGVKQAVRSYEDFAARNIKDRIDAARETEITSIAQPDSESYGVNWALWETQEVVIEPRTGLAACLPDPIYGFAQEKWGKVKSTLVNNGLIQDDSDDDVDNESQAVVSAREAVENAEQTLRDKQRDLDDHRGRLTKDYGKDDVFRPMEGQCITRDAGEYTYELCWMTHTMQKSKKGGSNSNMGNFEGFTTVTVDELTEAGKLEAVERVGLQYSGGSHCWQGPDRSTLVVLRCGEKDEILKVQEDEKCVYSMQVITPAVCEHGSADGAKGAKGAEKAARDEL